MNRRDVDVTLPWMGAGTEFVTRLASALPDDALTDPSALPGWSRAHVVAHLARNAEALTRLATWARTGVETPMYASPDQRAAEIESSARSPAPTLHQELTSTASEFDAALAALDDGTWQAQVRSALGRAIPATELPWMRIREVWLHAVDLDAGAGMADLPSQVVDAMLDDVTTALSGKDGCPQLRLEATDGAGVWRLGPDHDGVVVTGPAAALLGWVTGRTDGSDLEPAVDALPELPRWL